MRINSLTWFSQWVVAGSLVASSSLAASSAETAVHRDIFNMLSGQSRTAVASTDQGVFLETRHCVKGKQPVVDAMQGRLKVDQERELLELFQSVLCASRSPDGMGDLALAQFGERVADPFKTGMVIYMGMQELGAWPLDVVGDAADQTPRDQAVVSMFGLSPDSSIPAVSRWEVLSPTHVRVWFGPFRQAPSDAMTYDFELRDKGWVWVSALSSTRL